MDVFILAAGRGERLRPLTDTVPKPLIEINGMPLIEHRIRALATAGLTNIVINHAHLGDRIMNHLGGGERLGVHIKYADESSGVLDTGGGIVNALSLLESDPFLVVNSDIWTDYPFDRVRADIPRLAHLVLVDNPAHRREGDFCLWHEQVLSMDQQCPGRALTFAGIAVYRRTLFDGLRPRAFPLAPVLRVAADQHQVSGEHYVGTWFDVGTPQRLRRARSAAHSG